MTSRPTAAEMKERWLAFLVGLEREVKKSQKRLETGVSLAPYDSPDGVLKRGIYKFVKEQRDAGLDRLLETALDDLRTADVVKKGKNNKKPKPEKQQPKKQIRHRKKTFSENPYHCALRALPPEIRKFRGDDYTRMGRQLLYADRHEIDPDLLIGFLAQTGTVKQIAEKAVAEPEKQEEWFRFKQEAAKLTAAKKSRYPLAIIHFTATSAGRYSCPIEVGFARARGRNEDISMKSILIRPEAGWNISEKWPRASESETGISITDLLNSDPALEVIQQLAELSEGMAIVHCDNVSNVSHWLDMLIIAAEKKTDFQLRDIGDFLDHNANKRAELRRKLSPIALGMGSAGSEAQQLCEAVRSLAKR